MKERREYVRFNVPVDVYYRMLESLQEHTPAYTKNIAEKGISLTLYEKFEPGTYLEIALKFADDPAPVWGIGRIMWVKPHPNGKTYDTGIELTHIKCEDKERFVKLAML